MICHQCNTCKVVEEGSVEAVVRMITKKLGSEHWDDEKTEAVTALVRVAVSYGIAYAISTCPKLAAEDRKLSEGIN